jgi:hypothetical protein
MNTSVGVAYVISDGTNAVGGDTWRLAPRPRAADRRVPFGSARRRITYENGGGAGRGERFAWPSPEHVRMERGGAELRIRRLLVGDGTVHEEHAAGGAETAFYQQQRSDAVEVRGEGADRRRHRRGDDETEADRQVDYRLLLRPYVRPSGEFNQRRPASERAALEAT